MQDSSVRFEWVPLRGILVERLNARYFLHEVVVVAVVVLTLSHRHDPLRGHMLSVCRLHYFRLDF